jgi:hypothetical protein
MHSLEKYLLNTHHTSHTVLETGNIITKNTESLLHGPDILVEGQKTQITENADFLS